MSYQSKYTGQEIDNKLDKVGEVGTLDSAYCCLLEGHTPVVGQPVPFHKISGSMTVTDGKITVRPGQRVQIEFVLGYNVRNTTANIQYCIKDITNDFNIQLFIPFRDDTIYEYPDSAVVQYTNETNEICEVALVPSKILRSDSIAPSVSSLTVFEIGRAMVVPSKRTETILFEDYCASELKEYSLNDTIFNYDEIEIVGCQGYVNGGAQVRITSQRLCTSIGAGWFSLSCMEPNISYYLDGYITSSGNTIKLNMVRQNGTDSTRKAGLCKVIGIKY